MAPNPYAKYAPPADAAPANPYARYAGPTVGQGPSDVSRAGTYIDNLGRMFANGAFLGFADELTAAASAATVMPQRAVQGERYGGPQPGDVYDEELKRNRLRDEEFSKANPTASILAQVAGGLSATPMMPFLGAVKGAGLLTNTLRGAATGAGYGGVAGFGHGTGGLDNRLLNAGIGTVGGGVLGGVAPGMIAGASLLGRMAKESPAGQFIGREIMAPAMDKAAGVVEALAPKMRPKSLSAAAPDGGVPVPVEGFRTSVAEMLRNRADAARGVTDRAAIERLAREFDRQRLDPQALALNLENMPGAMLANAARDGELTRIVRNVRDLPGPAQTTVNTAIREQGEGAPQRMRDAFPPAPALSDAQAYIAANKSQVGAQGFDAARAAGLNVSDDMQRLLEDVPAVRRAWDRVIAEAADKGERLTAVDIAHRTKRFIADEGEAAYRNEGVSAKGAGDLADRWRAALHDANPAIREADEAFARAAGFEGTIDRGSRWMRQGTTPDAVDVEAAALARFVPTLDDAGVSVLRAGATGAARVPINKGPTGARRLAGELAYGPELQDRLAQIYGPERARAIIETARNERLFMDQAKTMVGGSQSSTNLAGLFDEVASTQPAAQAVGAPSIMARIADWGLANINKHIQGNEGVREAIARLATERNLNANAQTLDLVTDALRRRLEAQARNARIGAGASSAAGGEVGGVFNGP